MDADNDQKLVAEQPLAILDLLRSLVNILFVFVFAVAFSCVLRIVCQYAWEENVHLTTDFAKGIPDNCRQTAAICCLLPWVPALIPNFYCHILGGLLDIVLTPFILLGWTLFCYNRFDAHINPQVCPELIGKGTFSADKNNIK